MKKVSLETADEELSCKAWSLARSKCPTNPFHRQGCWAHAGNAPGWLVRIWGDNVKVSLWQWGQMKSKSKSWFLNSFHVVFQKKKKKAKQIHICLGRGISEEEKRSPQFEVSPHFISVPRELDSKEPSSWFLSLKLGMDILEKDALQEENLALHGCSSWLKRHSYHFLNQRCFHKTVSVGFQRPVFPSTL